MGDTLAGEVCFQHSLHPTGQGGLPTPHTLLLSEPFPTDMVWVLWLLGPLFQRLCLPAGIFPSQLKGLCSKNHWGVELSRCPVALSGTQIPQNPGSHPRAPCLEPQGWIGYVLAQLLLFPSLLWLCHQALKPVWRLFLLC